MGIGSSKPSPVKKDKPKKLTDEELRSTGFGTKPVDKNKPKSDDKKKK